MASLRTVVVFWLIKWSRGSDLGFPPGFRFGVSTAAYQVEGAWNASDKGESIWDIFIHSHPEMYNGDNGDIACNSYHNWKRDIDMISELGVHFYRFSISWPRILPIGFTNRVSKEGVNYYNQLIDGLLAKKIEPIITMFHWDLPQNLQNFGGWLNPLISDWFADYAKLLYGLYGDRVKTWITINEPLIICDMAYNTGRLAPGILESKLAPLICSKHVVMAHAKAWRIYEKDYKQKYHGKISISNHMIWLEGLTQEENELADLIMEYQLRYDHPIFSSDGGWPPALEAALANNTKSKAYPWPRLPKFTKQEIEIVRGTYDFYALNHYTSRVVQRADAEDILQPYPLGDVPEFNAKLGTRLSWGDKKLVFAIYPEGIRKSLAWIKRKYGNLEVIITENGHANIKQDLNDDARIDFIKRYLEQVLLAIKVDGVNVTAYTYWSLMDNFEWIGDGYSSKFGLFNVDFKADSRTRTPRKSAQYYASIVRAGSLEVPAEPRAWVEPSHSAVTATATHLQNKTWSLMTYYVLCFIVTIFKY